MKIFLGKLLLMFISIFNLIALFVGAVFIVTTLFHFPVWVGLIIVIGIDIGIIPVIIWLES